MQNIKFSTVTLLDIAAEVEATFPDQFDNRYFDLDRLLDILEDDQIFSDRERKIIYLRFKERMTIDEIVEAVDVPAEIVVDTISITCQKLFCFSKVYRSKEYHGVASIAAYNLLEEGDMYLHLFGNKTYLEVAEDFIRRNFKFNLEISRAHATIIALYLGFRGRELDRRYLDLVKQIACEKYDLSELEFSTSKEFEDHETEIVGDVRIDMIQDYLYRAVGHKVKILKAKEVS